MNKYCNKCKHLYNNILDNCPHCGKGNVGVFEVHLDKTYELMKREEKTKTLGGWCKVTENMPNKVPTKRIGRAIPTVKSIIKEKPPATNEWVPFDNGKDWGAGGWLKYFHDEKYRNADKYIKWKKKKKKSVGQLIQEAEARKAVKIEA